MPLLDGKYEILSCLGVGGFGEVFLAADNLVRRKVAIKVLRDRAVVDEGSLISEMISLASLELPNIVAFYHHFAAGGRLHLVMEFCEGGSLQDLLEKGTPIQRNSVLDWGKGLASTLAAVHQRGIVHHDLKPHNLLLTADGTLKVGDFGVANRDAGTLIYMPPEMLLGASATRDPRVDVYSLGITLLELLLGQNPFSGDSFDRMLLRKMEHQFIPLTLDSWLQELFLKTTHPVPELRFQSMVDFREAIEAKHVRYVYAPNRIKAHCLAAKAEQLLKRKRFRSAERRVTQALHFSPDCVAALIAAGRLNLLMDKPDEAEHHFSEALKLNPRCQIQKELGWLHLQRGDYAYAISMLNDHLERDAADFEAASLLVECFYLTGRYETAESLAHLMIKEGTRNKCFANNRFVCKLLRTDRWQTAWDSLTPQQQANPFARFNAKVAASLKNPLKPKLLFQDFRFGQLGQRSNNIVRLEHRGRVVESDGSIISIGRLDSNAFVIDQPSVSRFHCVVVNLAGDVWLYDLGSTRGTEADGKLVNRKRRLEGVHVLRLGGEELTMSSEKGLLV